MLLKDLPFSKESKLFRFCRLYHELTLFYDNEPEKPERTGACADIGLAFFLFEKANGILTIEKYQCWPCPQPWHARSGGRGLFFIYSKKPGLWVVRAR
ncbi:MAG: hypothetical protein DWI24_06730 [Planctomycetota bacterium]|nr:MAG: hypothetical protein DWI24_06730 [Planctomycetota bacterium]